MAVFDQKLLNTQAHCGHGCSKITHHEMGKPVERLLRKQFTEANATSHTTSWYTDTDGFLEHSPSGGRLYYKGPALQKIVLGCFGGSPSYLPSSFSGH